jgi:alkaline phosphatase/alkaline phosphatase D
MKQFIFQSLLLIFLLSCSEKPEIYLAQGLMAGEATESSVILQSRLTATDTLVNGDIQGLQGVARFLISVNQSFDESIISDWITADSTYDFIVKYQFSNLNPATTYYYRLEYGIDKNNLQVSETNSFKTNAGILQSDNSLVVVTGMNYYHHHYGKYDSLTAYDGADKGLGYPALVAISQLNPDYFIGTGDNVYFDHPSERDFSNAIKRGRAPHPGTYEGKEMVDEAGMRKKYHEQFYQQRFRALFVKTATYWEKDDHDYRMNDADPFTDFPISHNLGIKNFKEQLPVVDPVLGGVTYRTRRINRDLQLWFVEGRDYRDANDMEPGPEKTIWGKEQLLWLKTTLQASDATFKLLISPTPMVGPDDASKRDNHVNPDGFRDEGEAFFDWLVDNNFLDRHLYIVCGDRHWQYHAQHPKGIEEFSCGALVDNNSRAGRLAGDPKSTDPDAMIKQFYVQGTSAEATGGFLFIKNTHGEHPQLHFEFYNDDGLLLYKNVKTAQ